VLASAFSNVLNLHNVSEHVASAMEVRPPACCSPRRPHALSSNPKPKMDCFVRAK